MPSKDDDISEDAYGIRVSVTPDIEMQRKPSTDLTAAASAPSIDIEKPRGSYDQFEDEPTDRHDTKEM